MITASIVLYKTSQKETETIVHSVIQSKSIEKLYVIDNSPTDALAWVKDLSPIIEYIKNKNTGYGSSHNIALRKAIERNSDYHIVLNPDIIFEPHVIPKIKEYMDSNSDIGLTMPKVVYPDGTLQYLCKLIPTPLDLIFKRFLPQYISNKITYKFQLKFTTYNKEMEVPYLSGCFMFLRTSALKKIGIFDERFFMYPEDIDISRRMNEQYKTMYYPAVSVIHAHAAESYKSKKMLFIHIKNIIIYFNKWGWVFDKKRKETNKRILKNLHYNKGVY